MVWLSGGMFAIACLMILSLLAFVLWQGLWTLWPRNYSIYSRNDGSILGGELYSKQSIDGQNKLYLRTGNYDISSRHFAYVSSLELSDETPWTDPVSTAFCKSTFSANSTRRTPKRAWAI